MPRPAAASPGDTKVVQGPSRGMVQASPVPGLGVVPPVPESVVVVNDPEPSLAFGRVAVQY